MPDFKSMTPEELAAWCKDQGQPAFRGKQSVPVAPPWGDLYPGDDRPAQGLSGHP